MILGAQVVRTDPTGERCKGLARPDGAVVSCESPDTASPYKWVVKSPSGAGALVACDCKEGQRPVYNKSGGCKCTDNPKGIVKLPPVKVDTQPKINVDIAEVPPVAQLPVAQENLTGRAFGFVENNFTLILLAGVLGYFLLKDSRS